MKKIKINKNAENSLEVIAKEFGVFVPILFENPVYEIMESITKGASTDFHFWDFYKTENGSAFMSICTDEDTKFKVRVQSGAEGEVSAEAASLMASLMALHCFYFMAVENKNARMIKFYEQKYYKLYDFIRSHPEAEMLCYLLD